MNINGTSIHCWQPVAPHCCPRLPSDEIADTSLNSLAFHPSLLPYSIFHSPSFQSPESEDFHRRKLGHGGCGNSTGHMIHRIATNIYLEPASFSLCGSRFTQRLNFVWNRKHARQNEIAQYSTPQERPRDGPGRSRPDLWPRLHHSACEGQAHQQRRRLSNVLPWRGAKVECCAEKGHPKGEQSYQEREACRRRERAVDVVVHHVDDAGQFSEMKWRSA